MGVKFSKPILITSIIGTCVGCSVLIKRMGNCLKKSAHEDTLPTAESDENQQNMRLNIQQTIVPDREIFPVYNVSPYLNHQAVYLTEEQEIEIVKRIGLIQNLPTTWYNDTSQEKCKECVICMDEFLKGDCVRFLPCTHMYHKQCIDSWLIRNFTCPSCMEPLDMGAFSTCETIHNDDHDSVVPQESEAAKVDY